METCTTVLMGHTRIRVNRSVPTVRKDNGVTEVAVLVIDALQAHTVVHLVASIASMARGAP